MVCWEIHLGQIANLKLLRLGIDDKKQRKIIYCFAIVRIMTPMLMWSWSGTSREITCWSPCFTCYNFVVFFRTDEFIYLFVCFFTYLLVTNCYCHYESSFIFYSLLFSSRGKSLVVMANSYAVSSSQLQDHWLVSVSFMIQ